jgi:selenocysteine-specific elongation factor
LVLRPGHAIRFSPQQEQAIQRLMARFAASPYAPPSVKECQAEVGEDVVAALIDLERLVAVAPDVVFSQEDYQRMVGDVRRMIQQNGTLTVAQARDHFNTSRRYVLAFLEYLDTIGVTTRQGDERKLKSPQA